MQKQANALFTYACMHIQIDASFEVQSLQSLQGLATRPVNINLNVSFAWIVTINTEAFVFILTTATAVLHTAYRTRKQEPHCSSHAAPEESTTLLQSH